ncbi:hypothetical protein BJV82DRAFT_79881 [Fennellomyces sp. T-0311]|nr:hypothetical protein BJV82DRAFT_79881 [Fennellomyces sp. T-0311]
MGNQQSQSGVPDVVASSLSPKGRRRISKSPFLQTFMETANAPRNMPSLTSTWYETSSPLYTNGPQRKKAVLQQNNAQPLATQNQNQQVVTTTTTTRRGSGNSKSPQYVVTTTTYYIKGASKRASSSEGSSPLKDPSRRLSSISQAPSQASSSNASVFSDIDLWRPPKNLEYTTVDGRKFMTAPGIPYRMVCDDDESDRLIILHFLLKYAFNGNVVAPIGDILTNATLCGGGSKQKRPQVVDVGCGPGTWVLEMATEFPNADFHGVDICPMFPGTIKPSNAIFRQQNILDGLPYPDNSIDYLHVRLMLSCLTQAQALKLLGEIMRVLKPGAYVELRDVEYRIQRPGPVTDALVNRKCKWSLSIMIEELCD